MSLASPERPNPGALAFYIDMQPPASDFRADVLEGLRKPQKALSPKYFYDEEGSRIFDRITQAPEYYVTDVELELLDQAGPSLRTLAGSGAVVLEPGAGSSVKIRKLLDALEAPAAFVGMDISGDHVRSACESLAAEIDLPVGAVCHDFTAALDLDRLDLRDGKRVVFFPGSTIGNFELVDALGVLKTLRSWLRPGDALLVGADLRKDGAALEAAYDDAGGATADFNYNLIARINRELDGTMERANFRYAAFWNPYRSRVEMYLVSLVDQSFTVAGERFSMRETETIHTENSHKFTVGGFQDLAARAGLAARDAFVHPTTPFSLHWLEPDAEA